MRKKIKPIKKFICKYCGEQFDLMMSRDFHLKTHPAYFEWMVRELIKAKEVEKQTILKWCNDYFDNIRKNNDMWRKPVNSVCDDFLDELEKYLKER